MGGVTPPLRPFCTLCRSGWNYILIVPLTASATPAMQVAKEGGCRPRELVVDLLKQALRFGVRRIHAQ